MAEDPMGRVACETLVTTGLALVAGEITTKSYIDFETVVRKTVDDVGYVSGNYGFDSKTCAVMSAMDRQSPDIAMGVDTGGAGDQGMMFGYASDETPTLMPATIHFAHAITNRLAQVRRSGQLPWIRPDGKSQVTVEFENHEPVRVHTVVVSTQHDPDIREADLHEAIAEKVIKPALPAELYDENDCILHINPTGRFVIGGPHGDTGLTGRKIIVDTYGGVGRHGGGAFSGKDPTKVDRSASYGARWAAKNVVAAGLARRCEIQLAYAIGVAEPVSVHVRTFDTGTVSEAELAAGVSEVFDFRPAAIIEELGLRKPIYTRTAAYGHFGRNPEMRLPDTGGTEEVCFFPWEITDRVDDLKTALGT